MRTYLLPLVLVALVARPARGMGGERERWATLAGGVRLYVNAPARLDPAIPTRLVLFATPNGNTIEQTLGAARRDGLDWHYDIQHVAAQVRRLRQVNTRENTVLAVTQPPKLSWPAFRQGPPDANRIIRSVVDEAARDLPGASVTLTLTGHSGGGSFIFGFINGADAIPGAVSRIAFLDANYAYDDPTAKHGDKLIAWLNGGPDRRLIVIAYDDREIMLDGKKVVGPNGGTFRATGRMLARFKQSTDVTEQDQPPFSRASAFGGRALFIVHRNPENKILHTALVGEMNGLLHALALGTPEESKWGAFGGPRAYAAHVGGDPVLATIPSRRAGAATGSAFARQIESLDPAAREAAVRREISEGNLPNFLRCFAPVTAESTGKDGKRRAATYYVMPDYLAVGSDDDFFRVPMTPATAQALADAFNCSLMTRKMSDDVYRAAQIKLAPRPLTEDREAARTFFEHHRIIESQRTATRPAPGAPRALVAGIKKDVVVTNRLSEKPERVAIYGWHRENGAAIQPLTIVHKETYVDYSHGVRLVSRRVMVDGRETDLAALLADPALSALVSDEGPITARYRAAESVPEPR